MKKVKPAKLNIQVVLDNHLVDVNDSKKWVSVRSNDMIACIDGVLQILEGRATISHDWYGLTGYTIEQMSTVHDFYELPDGRIGLRSQNVTTYEVIDSSSVERAGDVRFRIFDSLAEIRDEEWKIDQDFFDSYPVDENNDEEDLDSERDQSFCCTKQASSKLLKFIEKCEKRWVAQQVAQELED